MGKVYRFFTKSISMATWTSSLCGERKFYCHLLSELGTNNAECYSYLHLHSHAIQIRYHLLLFSDHHFTPYNSMNADDLCFNRDYPTLPSRAESPPWRIYRCETLSDQFIHILIWIWTVLWLPHYNVPRWCRAPIQYPIRHLILRSHKVSKPRKLYFEISDRSDIWQALRQHCCRCACQISKQCEHFNTRSRVFETLSDLTIKRIIRYWNGALDSGNTYTLEGVYILQYVIWKRVTFQI